MNSTMNWEQYHMMRSCHPQQNLFYPQSSNMIQSSMSTPMQSPSFSVDSPRFPESENYRRRSNESKNGSKKCRRYKTPSPQLLRQRRSAANERERKRMNTLNVAYEQLRLVLPVLDSGKKLSKYETLQMAQNYIECLAKMLKTGKVPNEVIKMEH